MGGNPPRERLADAGHALRAGLEAAEAVVALPDQTGVSAVRRRGEPESAIPGNTGALYVITRAHEQIRRLEAEVRERVTGEPAAKRGGSDGNTHRALAYLAAAEVAIGDAYAAEIAAVLEHTAALAMALPAVAGAPQWVKIRLPDGTRTPRCPWCGTPNLRYNEPRGVIACLFPPCPAVTDGHRPWAAVNREGSGRVTWAWPDGTEQP
jgi:hypothetical protein